ncbi:DUF4435 domain-containing protein [Enterobacter kobei]|uniref:DUF4435 domain-containing protein n=1 Tax=Enterobacter kobei TaxID=208224 RepID=UPI0020261A25|nr:DUF4435 domain-containing protein [Enterobacter kobei]HBK4749103.1 DUF4435 domain-containing protein [Enterobacter hormaechei subsp. steigerwaltii]HCA7381830.1 DUF4435 domain-containing protein [Enterobacter hormaechei]URL26653.1 DUF4435 domain-containing protein [Enterobacter kobei]HBK4750773.1 DUF4435 domain-containing protein [Enterobacter hormaechei subsp. steigerwaltii]HCA7384690.1 DUF4435 domain-containing protein [Enterobacter hormaechei]
MDDSRFNMMMDAIKKPCVLRLRLIKNKEAEKPLFVFEGDDDYDFYHHALVISGYDKAYAHINGAGKDQSISLYKELDEEGSEYLMNTYFFVDQDYSNYCHCNKNVFTLPFYAIENPLSNERVIKHFIVSNFKFDERHKKIIDSVMSNYEKAKASFYQEIKEISVQLYMSRILKLGVEFPKSSDIFDKIEKDKVILKVKEVSVISERLRNLSDDERKYYEVIKTLDDDKLIRGKYVYYFVSEWLMRIKKYINSRIDSLNAEQNSNDDIAPANDKKLSKQQYDYTDLSIARLVPACMKINRLDDFLKNI